MASPVNPLTASVRVVGPFSKKPIIAELSLVTKHWCACMYLNIFFVCYPPTLKFTLNLYVLNCMNVQRYSLGESVQLEGGEDEILCVPPRLCS